jgi:hypothetical protein
MSEARKLIAQVCNEHRNSDLRADNPHIIYVLDRQLRELRQQLADVVRDKERLDYLNNEITDFIYLDDGRVIDVRGWDVRKAIDTYMDSPHKDSA